jgi:hypothetical protein
LWYQKGNHPARQIRQVNILLFGLKSRKVEREGYLGMQPTCCGVPQVDDQVIQTVCRYPVVGHQDTSSFKKTPLKPHLKDCWCIPPEQSADFVFLMEEML